MIDFEKYGNFIESLRKATSFQYDDLEDKKVILRTMDGKKVNKEFNSVEEMETYIAEYARRK